MWYDNIIIDIKKRWDGVGNDTCSHDAHCVSITTVMGYRVDHFFNSDGKRCESKWYSKVNKDHIDELYVNEKYEYDDKGNLIKILNHRINKHLGTNDTMFTLEFQYDENGKISYEILDGVRYKIEYDDSGNSFCDDADYQKVKIYKKWGI